MTAFAKYDQFVEDLASKVHNLVADTLKVALTNRAPVPGTDALLADISEISSGNGYTSGGNAAAFVSGEETAGVFKLVLADPATWTASGGTIGPFRYAVLYNSTASGGPLIGYHDYGSSITLAVGETFQDDFDPSTGVLTIT